MDVHDDGGGALLHGKALGHVLLQADIDRQLDAIALVALVAAELADHAADRVHLHLARPGLAAQRLLVLTLDAGLADLETGNAEDGIAGQLRFRNRADIADTMRRGAERSEEHTSELKSL